MSFTFAFLDSACSIVLSMLIPMRFLCKVIPDAGWI